LGFSFVALRHLSPSFFGASGFGVSGFATVSQSGEGDRNILFLTQQESLRQMQNRPVYPYSVVPGGVKSASELKWMAQHDAVVASHYAGFDYEHARMVRLISARTAYVSYRIGNRLYFTRHRIMLRKGETVITDGRSRHAPVAAIAWKKLHNRQLLLKNRRRSSSISPFFPPLGRLFPIPSVPFQSALLNRPALGPALPLGLYDPLGNANWVPIMPPRCLGFAVWEKVRRAAWKDISAPAVVWAEEARSQNLELGF